MNKENQQTSVSEEIQDLKRGRGRPRLEDPAKALTKDPKEAAQDINEFTIHSFLLVNAPQDMVDAERREMDRKEAKKQKQRDEVHRRAAKRDARKKSKLDKKMRQMKVTKAVTHSPEPEPMVFNQYEEPEYQNDVCLPEQQQHYQQEQQQEYQHDIPDLQPVQAVEMEYQPRYPEVGYGQDHQEYQHDLLPLQYVQPVDNFVEVEYQPRYQDNSQEYQQQHQPEHQHDYSQQPLQDNSQGNWQEHPQEQQQQYYQQEQHQHDLPHMQLVPPAVNFVEVEYQPRYQGVVYDQDLQEYQHGYPQEYQQEHQHDIHLVQYVQPAVNFAEVEYQPHYPYGQEQYNLLGENQEAYQPEPYQFEAHMQPVA